MNTSERPIKLVKNRFYQFMINGINMITWHNIVIVLPETYVIWKFILPFDDSTIQP